MVADSKARLGKRLQLARDKRGFTMAELANKAGVSTAFINDLEKGRHSPSTDKTESLAKALNVDPCWLAYGTGLKPEWGEQKD